MLRAASLCTMNYPLGRTMLLEHSCINVWVLCKINNRVLKFIIGLTMPIIIDLYVLITRVDSLWTPIWSKLFCRRYQQWLLLSITYVLYKYAGTQEKKNTELTGFNSVDVLGSKWELCVSFVGAGDGSRSTDGARASLCVKNSCAGVYTIEIFIYRSQSLM